MRWSIGFALFSLSRPLVNAAPPPIPNVPPGEIANQGQYVVTMLPWTDEALVNIVKAMPLLGIQKEIKIDDLTVLIVKPDVLTALTTVLGLVGVALIEPDYKLHAIAALPQGESLIETYPAPSLSLEQNSSPSDGGTCSSGGRSPPPITVQKDTKFNLDLISHRTTQTDPSKYEYIFANTSPIGAQTCAYGIDTGVRKTHLEFQDANGNSRVIDTIDCIGGDCEPYTGIDPFDGNGHGTHTMGSTAGKTFGVAKDAKIIGIRVLNQNGSGALSDVIAGISYAADDFTKRPECAKGSGANLSLGSSTLLDFIIGLFGGGSTTMAVRAADKLGLFFSIAAGNNDMNSYTASPANAREACTVGAVDANRVKACFSDFGRGTDVWAPGVNVTAAWGTGDNVLNTISGTSMAAPHVLGMKLYLDAECSGRQGLPRKSPKDICAYMKNTGVPFTYKTDRKGASMPFTCQPKGLEQKGAIIYNGGDCPCAGW